MVENLKSPGIHPTYSIHNGEFEHCSRLSSIVVHQRYQANILLAKDNEYFKVISQEIKVE